LRNNHLPGITKMCAELLDEARRDDPIKAAYSSAKHHSGGDNNNNNNNNNNRNDTRGHGGSRGGLGRGNRGGGRGGGNSQGNRGGGNQTGNKSTAERAHCKLCNHTHYGAGDNCWHTYPHKATPEWRERNAELLKSKKDGSNAATIKDDAAGDLYFTNGGGLSFATVRKTPVIDISDTVRELAGRSEYHNRLILDTGATDHLCNDHSKFVNFDQGGYYAIINTRAGPITVTQKGTIKVTVLCSDGSSQQVSFTNV
ncbi:uncharacterized protein M421DRAFT_43017, partial [Didymella exigua CBS 183.55]